MLDGDGVQTKTLRCGIQLKGLKNNEKLLQVRGGGQNFQKHALCNLWMAHKGLLTV